MQTKKNKNNGFTLIEMLVSSAIGAIILAALFISFTMFQRSYELQREMTRNQENGRIVLDYMVEEIRNAGYNHFNQGNPVPINQALLLRDPFTNASPSGTLPADCGERISVMYDIVPSQSDMGTHNFVRRRTSYYGMSFAPGGGTTHTRCRLWRQVCHYAYNPLNSTFLQIPHSTKYPCEDEKILDYLYDLSFAFSDYKYDHIAGRLSPVDRTTELSHNYASNSCYINFMNNTACTQYATRIRTIDMSLSIVSGKEVSSVPDNPSDNPDKGRRFLTHFNATMVLRNL